MLLRYFFESNTAVDGCASKSEPGHEQFEWLRIQLEMLRGRGMKAMLMGHVPPARVDSKVSWDETCWQKYALWLRQYRDVIIGSFYGHMNIDHFMLQDFKDIKKHVKKGLAMTSTHNKTGSDEEFTIESAGDYLVDLRDTFAKIPSVSDKLSMSEDKPLDDFQMDYFHSILEGHDAHDMSVAKKKDGKKQSPLSKIGGEYGERYSLSFVQASIVPNYFPTLRVFEYNITGLENVIPESLFEHQRPNVQKPIQQTQIILSEKEVLPKEPAGFESDVIPEKKKNHEKEKKKPKRHKFKIPNAPSKSSPPGPAYSPQTLSLLGYKQYYANLSYINNDFHGNGPTNSEDFIDAGKWKEGHHKGKVKKGKPKPKAFKFHVEYDTLNDKIYGLKDLTVRSYLDLAKRISASKGGGKSLEAEDSQVYCGDEPDIDEVTHNEGDHQDKDSSADDMNTEKAKDKKKKKKKKHKKKKKKKSHNKVWYAFVTRAFVGTLGVADIEDQFG
jgi:endopolyphosphatase